MAKIDLTAFEWRELIFQGRNKEYGAYELRENSSRRHRNSLIYVTILAVALFNLPAFIKMVIPETKEKEERAVEMTNFETKKPEVKQEFDRPVTAEPPPTVRSSIQFTEPVIKPDEQVREENEVKDQSSLFQSNLAVSTADVKGNDEKGQLIENITVAITQEENKVFEVAEQMPKFPGDEAALYAFLNKNIKYPPSAQENGISGKVVVRFVVNKNGEVDRAEIVRSLDTACDREALRVVKMMPKWIPGRQNGEPVAVWFNLPVSFKLQ